MIKRKNVFVVGGGTGGHLFPAVALGEELVSRNYRVYLITDQRCAPYVSKNAQLKLRVVECEYFKGNILQKLRAIYIMAKAVIKSIYMILKNRPKIIIGFGSYTTVPTLLAAKILKVPVIIHEQNRFLGKANRFFAKYARFIALGFDTTLNIPEDYKSKTIVTGNLVRKHILQMDINKDYDNIENFKIFVFGGSQGAKFFTSLMPNALKLIYNGSKLPVSKISIIQQAAKSDINILKRAYMRMGIEYEIAEFFRDMREKYRVCHLAICRAGASTIAELIAAQQPAIYIPYPHAMHNHQLLNAQYMERCKAGWYYEQAEVTPEMIAKKILEIMSSPDILKATSASLNNLKQDSTSHMADIVETALGKKLI